MKKLILIAATAAVAQTASAQLSLAPEVGFQMTKVNTKMLGESVSNDMKAGFRAGVNADMGITEHFHVSAGLFYSGMGTKMDVLGTTATLNLSYLQLPVYVNYMTGEAGGNRFFVGLGPYLGYAVGAKAKADGDSQKLDIGSSDDDDFKAMDFGLNFNAGYMLSMGIYARAFYSMGLSNIKPGGDSDNSYKNMGFGLSIGYNLPL